MYYAIRIPAAAGITAEQVQSPVRGVIEQDGTLVYRDTKRFWITVQHTEDYIGKDERIAVPDHGQTFTFVNESWEPGEERLITCADYGHTNEGSDWVALFTDGTQELVPAYFTPITPYESLSCEEVRKVAGRR